MPVLSCFGSTWAALAFRPNHTPKDIIPTLTIATPAPNKSAGHRSFRTEDEGERKQEERDTEHEKEELEERVQRAVHQFCERLDRPSANLSDQKRHTQKGPDTSSSRRSQPELQSSPRKHDGRKDPLAGALPS